MTTDCDVAIIGAGAAGLAALHELSRAGIDVRCIEARNRIGGRIWTRHDPSIPVPIELGAEFVHGRPPEVWDMARRNGLRIEERPIRPAYVEQDRILDALRIEGGVKQALSDLQAEANRRDDLSFETFLNQSAYSAEVKQWSTAYVEGFNAAHKDRISVRALVEEAEAARQIEGDHLFSISDGYDSLLRILTEPVQDLERALFLDTIIERVDWAPREVTLRARSATTGHDTSIRCERAIFTLPLGVLLARPGELGAVRFDPPPGQILEAARSLQFGSVVRVMLRFETPFWERRPEFAEATFFYSPEPVFPTWWKRVPAGVPVLTGWSSGPAAEKLLGLAEHEITTIAVRTLEKIVGLRASALCDAFLHDWQRDPFSRGAYSYVTVGSLGARDILAQPVMDTLYFAGEAAAGSHSATVHGAIASGTRAARQIISVST